MLACVHTRVIRSEGIVTPCAKKVIFFSNRVPAMNLDSILILCISLVEAHSGSSGTSEFLMPLSDMQ